MVSYRTRYRRRRRRDPLLGILAGLALLIGIWWIYPKAEIAPEPLAANREPLPLLTTDRPERDPVGDIDPDVPERGANGGSTAPSPQPSAGATADQRIAGLIAAGKKALENKDSVAARSHFSDALAAGAPEPQRSLLRAELTRIGTETIFSQRVLPNDPLTQRYVIQPGDTLGKIAKAHHISDDLLAEINGIRNKNLIRAGQTIKVVQGPFHATVESSTHTMGVYLGKVFVRQYRVGLGLDNGTPTGVWEVGTKLKNPTYYPPRGGRIIPPDDPENPLSGHWIGLRGVEGEALGQLRYGIHGTNEPDTIGKSVSLGCIRMFNEDVKQVYDCLIEKHSKVTVVQ